MVTAMLAALGLSAGCSDSSIPQDQGAFSSPIPAIQQLEKIRRSGVGYFGLVLGASLNPRSIVAKLEETDSLVGASSK